MPLVTRSCAFRLRRLAQNACCGISAGIFPVNFCTNASCDMSMCISTPHPSNKILAAGLASGVFPVNFCTKCLLWHVHMHFDCAGSHHMRFPCNFPHKCLLWHVHVHFDCAGSHKMLAAGLASGIFPVNFRTKCLLWHVHMHFDCAGSHQILAAGLPSGIFPINFRTNASCDMSICISTAQARTKFWPRDYRPAFSL